MNAPTIEELLTSLRIVTDWSIDTPREELRKRLNTRLRGEDPGLPFNWTGPRK